MSNKGQKIQDLPLPKKCWTKPEPHQVLAAPAAAATPRGYGEGIRRTQGERGQPGPSQPGGQLHPARKSKQAKQNCRRRVCRIINKSSLISRSSVAHQSLISHSSVTHQSLISRSSVAHQSLISCSSVAHQSLISLSSVAYQSLISRSDRDF